jgi:maltose alpha-D-glucosyltransferase/alpha-amylase
MPDAVHKNIGFYLLSARTMGQRTAELHVKLASVRNDPVFAPESFSDLYRRSLYQSMRNLANEVFRTLRRQRRTLSEEIRDEADRVISLQNEALKRFQSVLNMRITAMRTRVHGDYHLGQILYAGGDFVIIDFEGEPARSMAERRLKRSPLRDVAGMIRSFHYATNAALLGQASTIIRPEDLPRLEHFASYWYRWVSAAFLSSYLEVASESVFLPRSQEELKALMDVYLLEKAIYEVNYELNNRPGWLRVPLQGILELLETEQS